MIISFNEVVIFSVIGRELVVGKSNVGVKKFGYTAGAWATSFFAAIGGAYGLGELVQCLIVWGGQLGYEAVSLLI